MQTAQWHADNQAVLTAAIEAVRLRLLGQPDADALAAWQAAEVALDGPSTLAVLRQTFTLSAFEEQVVVLCAGAALENRIGAALKQQGAGWPSFHLALRLFPDSAHWNAAAPEAALRYWQIVQLDDSRDFLHTALRLDERILHALLGTHTLPADLLGLVSHPPEPASQSTTARSLTPSQMALARQITALHHSLPAGRLPAFVLQGRDADACHACAGVAYHDLGLHMLTLRADALPTDAAERVRLARLLERETLLQPGAVYLDAHGITEAQGPLLAAFVHGYRGLLCIGVGRRLDALPRSALHLELSAPTTEEQITLWQGALGGYADRLNGAVPQLAHQFDLPARQIALLGMRLQGALDGQPAPDAEAITTQLWGLARTESRTRLDGLAQRITSSSGWDDLVLPQEQQDTLHEIMIHVAHRFQVYSEWGFARQNNRGLGITALFAGESGTGKTLAAEVIANQLRLDLYRIDLSSVVSKYIGETEKNLARIFDAAESMSAVLLFDEADALFGKRSEVKDSHDRYANIEVSYLLQRMEAYRGLAILTTNFKRNLDGAFLRRLRFIVSFPFPAPVERAQIWRRIFPAQAPVHALDYARLAQLNITGGQIKNIAMNAAFLAAHRGQPVGMDHILHAAHGEYAKQEKPLTGAEVRGWS